MLYVPESHQTLERLVNISRWWQRRIPQGRLGNPPRCSLVGWDGGQVTSHRQSHPPICR